MDSSPYDNTYNMGHSNSDSSETTEVFARHSDSVLCCSISCGKRIAVSGGIDDTAFVWDLNTKHVIFECEGHKESVVAAAFSVNSTYVATGDLSGYIQVRNTTTGIKVFDYDVDEINWIMWHNTSEFVLLAGTTKGDFWMWNVNDPAAIKTFPSYGSPTTAAKLLSDGMNIVSAYGDGSVRIFDLKTKQAVQLTDPTRAEIISIDVNPNKALLAVGCIDSTIKLITLNACKVIGTLMCKSIEKPSASNESTSANPNSSNECTNSDSVESCDPARTEAEEQDPCEIINSEQVEVIDEYNTSIPDTNGDADFDQEDLDDDVSDEAVDVESVESVLFSPCGNYLAASNNSGTIVIWEVSSQITRCELHTGIGITRCAWSDSGNYITGCLDGTVRIYDINLYKLNEIALHKDQILDVAYFSGVLVTASEDKTCKAIVINE